MNIDHLSKYALSPRVSPVLAAADPTLPAPDGREEFDEELPRRSSRLREVQRQLEEEPKAQEPKPLRKKPTKTSKTPKPRPKPAPVAEEMELGISTPISRYGTPLAAPFDDPDQHLINIPLSVYAATPVASTDRGPYPASQLPGATEDGTGNPLGVLPAFPVGFQDQTGKIVSPANAREMRAFLDLQQARRENAEMETEKEGGRMRVRRRGKHGEEENAREWSRSSRARRTRRR
jgi:hypothetical protein